MDSKVWNTTPNVNKILSPISKIESIRYDEIHKDLGVMCNNNLSLKFEYVHLEDLNLVKYMFYTEFDNHEWTQIILSRVHDDMFWLGDAYCH